jgi:glutathione S-transferase
LRSACTAAGRSPDGVIQSVLATSNMDAAVHLYGLARSVYTRIARLALEEKGVAYTLHEVEIFGPGGVPAEHVKRHPFGRIPALDHDGFQLYETQAITRYVDEAFRGPPLQPADAMRRARMNQIIGVLDAYAYRPMVWGVVVPRMRSQPGERPDEAKIAEATAAAAHALDALDALTSCAPYLLGQDLTLADLHAWPMLSCFAFAPEGAALLAQHAALQRWLHAMRQRPSVQRTRSVFDAPR